MRHITIRKLSYTVMCWAICVETCLLHVRIFVNEGMRTWGLLTKHAYASVPFLGRIN